MFQQEILMDRRALLGGLAAALVVGPALAQTSGSSPSMPSGSTGSMPMNRMGGQMSQADTQHMQQTMQLGMVAMESSRIAMNKVRNEDLKRFANFEVQEQTTLSEVLRSMMEPAATAATGSTASGQAGQSSATAMPAMQMDASARDMMQKMQNQQAGAEFDKMYLEAQLQGHRDLLQVQERYLQSNPQNREHMNIAKMARGHIREHIAMLEEMQKTMR
jgi:putative membrane protein